MSDNIEYNSYNHIKRLSDSELEALWVAYLADKTNKKLRDQIIVQYIYLTKYVIGRIKLNLPPNFAIEDITSFGVEGLIDAIEKFSPDKGAHFETYAIMRIRGTIIDKIRSQDWLPRSTRKKIKDIKQAKRLPDEPNMKPEQKPDVSHYEVYRGKNGDHYIEVSQSDKKRYYITKESSSGSDRTTSSGTTRSPNNIIHNKLHKKRTLMSSILVLL